MKRLRDRLHDRVVLERAGGGDHEIPRPVVQAVIRIDLIAAHRLDGLRRAEHAPPQRMGTPQGLQKDVVNDVVRLVFMHRDLLEHDLPLADHVLLTDERVLQHVGDELDGHPGVGVERAGVEAGELLRRERVQLAADLVERDRDVAGAPRRGALEQQVLEPVRDAGDLGRLVARAHADPHAQRHGTNFRHRLGEDPDAGVEVGPPYVHALAAPGP